MSNSTYIPGVCNIGKEEVNKRKNFAYFSLLITLSIFILNFLFFNNFYLDLLIFIPATSSAIGFLQVYFHFCAAFGFSGIVNFGKAGDKERVEDKVARLADLKKAVQILIYSSLIGLASVLLSLIS